MICATPFVVVAYYVAASIAPFIASSVASIAHTLFICCSIAASVTLFFAANVNQVNLVGWRNLPS